MSECLCHQHGETCSFCLAGSQELIEYSKSLDKLELLIPGFLSAQAMAAQCGGIQELESLIDVTLCSINELSATRTETNPSALGLEEVSHLLPKFNNWDVFTSAMDSLESAISEYLLGRPQVTERLEAAEAAWANHPEAASTNPPEPPAFVDLGPDTSAMMPGLDFVLELFKKAPAPETFQQNFMATYKSAMVQSSEMILASINGQYKFEGPIVIQKGGVGVSTDPQDPRYGFLLTKKVKRQGEEPSWCVAKEKATPQSIKHAKGLLEYYNEVASIPEGAARMTVENTLAPFSFQRRTALWMNACFQSRQDIIKDTSERQARFLEEAIELVQAGGLSKDSAQILLDYVYSRPAGELSQEVGGVGVTLAVLCSAHSVSMDACFEKELARVSEPATMERVREKQKNKPAHSPLPGSYPERQAAVVAAVPSAPSALSEEEAKAQVKSLFEFFVEDWMNEEDTALFLKTLWAEVGPTLQKSFVESSALGYSVEAIRNEAFIEIKRSYFKCPEVDVLILQTFLRNGFTIKPGERDLKPYVYEAARKLIAAVSGS